MFRDKRRKKGQPDQPHKKNPKLISAYLHQNMYPSPETSVHWEGNISGSPRSLHIHKYIDIFSGFNQFCTVSCLKTPWKDEQISFVESTVTFHHNFYIVISVKKP